MEKILTDSERIRRAEEIYARRRGIDLAEKNEKEKPTGIYRFLFRGLLLINIIVLVLCMQNKENIFNEEFLNQFYSYSGFINQKVNGLIDSLKENDEETDDNINVKDTTDNQDMSEKVEDTSEAVVEEQTIENKIKSSYSFIKPIEGTVTSFFGDRQSKYQNVTGYHTGIDIGAEKGTIIKAAMEGTVTQVSTLGDYRKSF